MIKKEGNIPLDYTSQQVNCFTNIHSEKGLINSFHFLIFKGKC